MNRNKRKQLDYSSDEQYSDDQPPNKKRKTETKNKKIFTKMLKVSSVLLQDEDVKTQYEIIINDDKKSYSFVEGRVGVNLKRKVKSFSSKKKAFNSALDSLMDKMNHNWSIVVSEAEESDSEDGTNNIFQDFVFALSGEFSKTHKVITKLINDHGGFVKPSVSRKTDFVIVPKNDADLQSIKCVDAITSNVPIVTEEYLYDSVEEKKRLQYDAYVIEEETTTTNSSVQRNGGGKHVKKKKKLDEKTKLKRFIKSHMDQDELKRESGPEYFPFKNVNDFYKHNFKIIDKMDKKMIKKLMVLKELIENGASDGDSDEERLVCKVMDKDSMAPFAASGFCFDKKGDLVVFNER